MAHKAVKGTDRPRQKQQQQQQKRRGGSEEKKERSARCRSAALQSASRAWTGLSSAPCPREGRGGWQCGDRGREGDEEERRGEERRAGLAGCGLKWQQIVWDTSDPFNSAGSAAACSVRAGRRGRNPGRAPARRQATCGRCCDSYPEEENEGRGEATTLQLGYQ